MWYSLIILFITSQASLGITTLARSNSRLSVKLGRRVSSRVSGTFSFKLKIVESRMCGRREIVDVKVGIVPVLGGHIDVLGDIRERHAFGDRGRGLRGIDRDTEILAHHFGENGA